MSAEGSNELFLEIIYLTAFKDGETICLKRIDRHGHIIEAKNQNGILPGFIDKGIHVFDVESDLLDTVKHLRQATGPIRHLNGNYGCLANRKTFLFKSLFSFLDLVNNQSQDSEVGRIGHRESPNIDIVLCYYRRYFS